MKALTNGRARTAYNSLRVAVEERTATIGVIGLGYVGLPLGRVLTVSGFRTIGFDTDEAKVSLLCQGKSYLAHIDSSWIAVSIQEELFVPSCDSEVLSSCDVLIICVPTPLNNAREPDLSYLVNAARTVAACLHKGVLVILGSTTYPGTTRDVVLPILSTAGLKLGVDYFLAYSPEREDPGNKHFSPADIPRVVGALDQRSLELTLTLFRSMGVPPVPVSSCEVAEAAKLLENSYRAVNIALVNELKVVFTRMDIDVWEVIEAARTKPYGFQAFYPGPGPGGHCIPVDPVYLSWIARRHGTATRMIELAGEINSSMPSYVVDRVVLALNEHRKSVNGSRICILGVSYKPDIGDIRESPSLIILTQLHALGAVVSYNDPCVPFLPDRSPSTALPDLVSQSLTTDFVSAQDCLVIITNHSSYDYDEITQYAAVIIDARNATAGLTAASIKKA